MLTFAEIVKDSHRHLYQFSYPDVPLDSDIAEDIVNSYLEYQNIDLSTPEKYFSWILEVRYELNRQNLKYRRDE